jgi:uncharacterized protein (TIGR03435 family)
MLKTLALVWVLTAIAAGQPVRLAYEVATIKLNTTGDGRTMISGIGPGARSNGRFTAQNIPLRQLIILAYADPAQGPVAPGGPGLSISGGPGWISTDRYDIDARPEAGFLPTLEQSQKMLQALLEERFHLKARRETKDGPIYALVVDKGGVFNKPGLRRSEDQSPVTPTATPGQAPPGFNPQGGGVPPRGLMMMGLGQMRATAQTITGVAGMLTVYAGRKVVNRTNLEGLYDVELKFTPDQPPAGATPPQLDSSGPSLFTALQEQLGLKLDTATGPLDSVVIERVEKPTEN